jgi:hypothetical protein
MVIMMADESLRGGVSTIDQKPLPELPDGIGNGHLAVTEHRV